MDSNRTAADLIAVQHDIIRLGTHRARVGIEQRNILVHRAGKGVMHRNKAILLLAPFELRELGDPQQIILAFGDQPELVRYLETQSTERLPNDRIFIRDDEQHIALFKARRSGDRFDFFFGEELGDRGLQSVFFPVHPRKTLGAIGLDKLAERVDFLAGELLGCALCNDAAHAAAVFDRILEHGESAIPDRFGQILQFHIEARIRFIGAIAVHGVDPLDAGQRKLYVIIEHFLEQTLQKALVHGHDIVFLDE